MSSPPTLDTPQRLPARALLMLAAMTLVWGAAWPVVKIGLNEISIFTYRAAAVILSATTAYAIAKARGASLRVPREVCLPLITAGLLFQGALA